MNTPDRFKIRDWCSYLFDAVRRENNREWRPKSTIVAAWTRVIRNLTENKEYETLDPFVLALALDVIALGWGDYVVTSPWEVLAPGKLFYKFSGRSKAFWRAVYFSRFASTDKEVQFYSYHLTQYEIGLSMVRGEAGRLELLRNHKVALTQAETVIRARGNIRPVFKVHWLRQRFGEE